MEQRTQQAIVSFLVVVVVVGALFFSVVVEFMDCPSCGGHPIYKYFCGYCGGDGKVTLVHYIAHMVAS